MERIRLHKPPRLPNGAVVVGKRDLGGGRIERTYEYPKGFFHLPSEVFVTDEEPDWEPVDVYCLANTLWCIAVEKLLPPRGQIRAGEDDSLALLLAEEPYIGQLAGVMEAATARRPNARPTLSAFADQLDQWLSARNTRDEFSVEYESAEARRLAVLRWLLDYVRREPVFDRLGYDVPDDLNAPSDIPGLTEGQVCAALLELIDDYAIEGEPRRAMGRREPRHFTRLYPTSYGVDQVDSLDAITSQAMPILRVFVTPNDWLVLPQSSEVVEVVPGSNLAPPEAYFRMRMLESQGLLSFRSVAETGGHVNFSDVRATSGGKRLLYQASMGNPAK